MATLPMTDENRAASSDGGDAGRAKRGLQALNFFMADMQAGIGPFLGVVLQQRGWATGPIGTVMTAGGVAGMICTAPAGAFIDHTERKRCVVIVTGICTVAASFLILFSQAGNLPKRQPAPALGHAVHAIGAWPVTGILGTQLGPNRIGGAS